MGGRSVPWIPRPKLIPEWDGMYGASGDAHLRSEVSGACRDLSFVLEALWRICRVHIYRFFRLYKLIMRFPHDSHAAT